METGLFEIQAKQLEEYGRLCRPQKLSMLCSDALTRSVTIGTRRQTASRTQQLCPAPVRNLLKPRLIPPVELARCFLRLANLPNFALDRLSRYEATLWRQAGRILYALDALDRRKPQERRRPSRADDWRELGIVDDELAPPANIGQAETNTIKTNKACC